VFVGFGFGIPIGFPNYYQPYPYLIRLRRIIRCRPINPVPASYPLASYPPAASYGPGAGHAPAGPAGTLSITHTPQRGWTNAQGEYRPKYRTTQGAGNRGTERYGTACRDATGQWRIVN
jgi:hypothetical protein